MTKSVAYVEIDVDYCSLDYGISPCTASVGVTGEKKCFNTLRTCQDRANFDNVPITLRFGTNSDFDALPYLESFSFSPSKISLAGDLGIRASLTVTLSDHPHSDTGEGFDKYVTERGFDPYKQGTFFGKFRARQPYLRERTLRLIQGIEGQDIADMEVRTFSIEGFNGPSMEGQFTLTAKDILKRADGDRAFYPPHTSASLVSGISNSATSISLTPAGVGDDEYPASGYVCIGGSEVVSFTRSGDSMTIVRGRYNTDGASHSAGDRVQLCAEFVAVDPADALNTIFTEGANIDPSEIPLSEWQEETAAYFGAVISTLISEPTPVNLLASEIISQCGLMVWWDDLVPEVRLRVLKGISTDALRFDETKILQGSLKVVEQPTQRFSRVETFYGRRNPVKSISDEDNYRAAQSYVHTEAEANDGKSVREIYSRWIATGGSEAADRVNKLVVGMFQEPPRKFTFEIYRHGDQSPRMGDGCIISYSMAQDDLGALADVPAQILRVSPLREKYVIEAQEFHFEDIEPIDTSVRPITLSSDNSNVNLRSLHDALYPAPVGGEEVTLTINSGVIVKATSTSNYALNIGSWPEQDSTADRVSGSPILTNVSDDTSSLKVDMFVSGAGIPDDTRIASIDSATQVTLTNNATSTGATASITFHLVRVTVNMNGILTGKGGKGANGRNGDNNNGYDGEDGGDALYTRYPFTLSGSGRTQGGGGGGGGGPGDWIGVFGPWFYGGAGGGGAGYGNGGSAQGSGKNGDNGTLNNGGDGGNSSLGSTGAGGDGGDRGSNGKDAGGVQDGPSGGDKGQAGNSVNGWSYVLQSSWSGSYYGSKVN